MTDKGTTPATHSKRMGTWAGVGAGAAVVFGVLDGLDWSLLDEGHEKVFFTGLLVGLVRGAFALINKWRSGEGS